MTQEKYKLRPKAIKSYHYFGKVTKVFENIINIQKIIKFEVTFPEFSLTTS